MTALNEFRLRTGGLLAAALLVAFPLPGWGKDPRRGPDLVVARLTHSPARPVTHQTITFTAVVQNVGEHKAKPSRLAFWIGGETPPGQIFSVPELAPGQELTVTRQMALNVAQSYRNTAIVDFDGRVNETNEANNLRTDDYIVWPDAKPDLIVAALTHSPAEPIIHQMITFTAVVKNVGPGLAPPSRLSFRVGGETPPAAVLDVPALVPGAEVTITRQLRLDVAQYYRNTAIADYDNRVSEMNETNNQRTDDYIVRSYTNLPVR